MKRKIIRIKTKSIFPNIHNWAAHNGHQRQETLLKSLKRGNDIYKEVKVLFVSRCNVRPSPKQDPGRFGQIVFFVLVVFLVFREERQRKILGQRGGRKRRAKSAPPFTLISSFCVMLWKRTVKVTAIPCSVGAFLKKIIIILAGNSGLQGFMQTLLEVFGSSRDPLRLSSVFFPMLCQLSVTIT